MNVREVAVMTPTIRRLKSERSRQSGMRLTRPYGFFITETELHRLVEAKMGMGAIVVFGLIRSAVRAARGHDWVSLSLRARESVPRSYKWWHAATQQLEAAGFIECKRHRGRLPLFRLVRRGNRTHPSS